MVRGTFVVDRDAANVGEFHMPSLRDLTNMPTSRDSTNKSSRCEL